MGKEGEPQALLGWLGPLQEWAQGSPSVMCLQWAQPGQGAECGRLESQEAGAEEEAHSRQV